MVVVVVMSHVVMSEPALHISTFEHFFLILVLVDLDTRGMSVGITCGVDMAGASHHIVVLDSSCGEARHQRMRSPIPSSSMPHLCTRSRQSVGHELAFADLLWEHSRALAFSFLALLAQANNHHRFRRDGRMSSSGAMSMK